MSQKILNSVRHAVVPSLLFLAISAFLVKQGQNDCFDPKQRVLSFLAFVVLCMVSFYLVKQYSGNQSSASSESESKPNLNVVVGYALYAGLLFFLLTSKEMYSLTNSVIKVDNYNLLNNSGCPTFSGSLVHAVVFLMSLASWQLLVPSNDISN
jgi:hypothetical protein